MVGKTCVPGKKKIHVRSIFIISLQQNPKELNFPDITVAAKTTKNKPGLHSSSTLKCHQFSALRPTRLVSPERNKKKLGLQLSLQNKCHQFSPLWPASLVSPKTQNILRLHLSSTIKCLQFSQLWAATLVCPERKKFMLGLYSP